MERISLGTDLLEGKNNAYLFPEDPVTFVDTGVDSPSVGDQLEASLAAHDLGFADVDQMLLTHFHGDHTGFAGTIQRAGDATVYVHERDAPLVARDPDAVAELEAKQREHATQWGLPADVREDVTTSMADAAEIYGQPATVTPFSDGDRFEAGNEELEAVHAPGHTAGQSMFAVRGEGTVFTGDALLPHYTPNVGGSDVRLDHSLSRYLDTLATVEAREFDVAWPGHRGRIDDPAGRASAIVDHHVERARRILSYLDSNGPADTWTISRHLFGSLDGVHALHGPGEVHAHIEHMEATGIVAETAVGYQVQSAPDDRRYREDATGWPLSDVPTGR